MEAIQLSLSESQDWASYISSYSPEHLSQSTCIHIVYSHHIPSRPNNLSQNSWAEHKPVT